MSVDQRYLKGYEDGMIDGAHRVADMLKQHVDAAVDESVDAVVKHVEDGAKNEQAANLDG